MVLKRATKSIPLSGGISQDVDDFLLEPSGMQYMENVRFTKQDMCEKAEPKSLISAATGITNYNFYDIYGMWNKGDKIAVVDNNEVSISQDAGVTWDNHSQDTMLLGIEKSVSSLERQGAINVTALPIGTSTGATNFVPTDYLIAYERVRPDTANIDNHRDVVMMWYYGDGTLREEVVHANAANPQLQQKDGANAVLNCVDTNGDIVVYLATQLNAWSYLATYARSINDYCQYYNTNQGWGAPAAERLPEDMRFGFSIDMRSNNPAMVAYQGWHNGTGYGVIAYKDGASIKWERTLNGGPDGTVQTIQTDSDPLYFKILDCHSDETYNYFLVGQANTTTLSGALWLYREAVAGGTVESYQIVSGSGWAPTNGSIHLSNAGTEMFVATTLAYGEPEDCMQASGSLHRANVYRLDGVSATWGPSVTHSRTFRSHRLCSKVAVDKDDSPHAVLQQWDNWNPDPTALGNNPNIPALTPTMKKPVTSIQIKWDWSRAVADGIDLVACYDAGTSKVMPSSIEEQNVHLPLLWYFSASTGEMYHNFWYGNRQQLTSEDQYYFLHAGTANTFPDNDARVPLHPGTARCNLYRLHSSIRVPYINFSDGMICGTSAPVWFDGSANVTLVSPLVAPEITFLTMDGDGASYLAYQDVGVSNEDPKYCQAVVGFYDDAGRVHRSPPSQELYFGNAKADTTTGLTVSARVTPPLGITTGRDYFVEIYEAFPGDVAQLCTTTWVSDNDASGVVAVSWATNLNPTTTAVPRDVTGYRSAKAIYTAGNVLASDPWPSFDIMVKSGRRLFAHSISDPSAIYYSKTYENGLAPEFNAALLISLGNEEITAMGAVDDKVIAWTRDEMFLIYGTGPDNTGANGDFFVEKFPHKLGCTDQDSILSYQDGIAFFCNNKKEFHLLTRDLQVKDIGSPIADITDSPAFSIEDALVYPQANELRWYGNATWYTTENLAIGDTPPTQPPLPWQQSITPTSLVYCYNFKYGKWSILNDTSDDFHKVILVNDKPAGLVSWNWWATSEDWTDSQLVKMETPWIKVNQLQDFGRFYKATFLGKYLSSWEDTGGVVEAGDIQVTVRYDYEAALGTPEEHLFRANVDFDPGDGNRLQLDVRPERQKCQAIKFIIEEVATTKVEVWEPTYSTGRGFILTAADLLYGAKGTSGSKSLGAKRTK